MPAARGVKRAASKSSAATASTGPKNKKKRGAIQLEIPAAPKRRGRVMTCGQGDVGQLGLGEDVIETNKFKLVTALGDKIVDIRAGGMHTVALDSSGKVWTFGCNDEGALGRVTRGEADEARAGAVPLPAPARRVAAGDSHSAALLRDGHVYAWGAFRDSHGTMGLVVRGREGKACREPVHIDLPEPAVDVASGGDHLVMLTTSGAVYTMGCGEQGQLGRLAQRSASRDARQGFSALLVPSKVTLKLGASRIWAGYHATFVLDANSDKMFAWGLNNYGQLGITGEKRRRALYSPTECDAFTAWREGCEEGAGGVGSEWRWRGVAAGQHHSLALDGAGAVLALGRCEYGRLGVPQPADAHLLTPVPRLRHKDVVSISASTSSSFAVTADGEIYSWGMGSEGQLGTGACADATEPTVAVYGADRRPIQVSAGGQHTVLLVEDPSSTKEPSPAPDQEMAEQTTEDENTEEEEVKAKRPKSEQEGEISSTSSAQASEVTEESKPQKVNGDETDTPMEVDDTDNSQDNSQEKKDEDTQDKPESEPEQAKEESKPESTDTSSVDTAASEPAELNGAHDGKCSPAPPAPAPAPAPAPEPAAEPAPALASA